MTEQQCDVSPWHGPDGEPLLCATTIYTGELPDDEAAEVCIQTVILCQDYWMSADIACVHCGATLLYEHKGACHRCGRDGLPVIS